ncbi:hypothetical protein [Streptomyces sp. WMMB303]|uniref:hypothetical protein n=1 Tax=Streptomyces sp. WMMB303 TaxID=3034154 RepID=UPI0023EC998E|nr:hypothetical protein [Streptomyces sp. WMMB303]MDF4250253.1 hypothetical protein [Streptomyces sp. WMMB303]
MTDSASSQLWRYVRDDSPDSLTLIVQTPNGAYMRRIPPALPRPSGVDHGTGAEAAAHTAAAAWGMPDFVFQQADHATKGSGRRELGDRILLAGGRGAVVQVKARTIEPKPDIQETSWIQKVAAKAMKQAKGTVRQLRILPSDMVNERGWTLRVDSAAYEWVAVFLLDHPHVPENTVVSWEPIGMPAIALTRRDWDFLFDQMRSTTAVLDYLFRAAAEPVVPLGEEPVRFYELAAADAAMPPKEIDTELLGPGSMLYSAPQLPQAPAGSDGTHAHLMIRIMLEDVATSLMREPVPGDGWFAVLSDFDRLPVSARAEWGHLLLDMLRDVPDVPADHLKWRFRRLVEEDGTRQLIVGAATRFDPSVQAAF